METTNLNNTVYGDYALRLLNQFYLEDHEKTPEEAFRRTCRAFSNGDKRLEDSLYEAVCKGWFMFSSPILSNAPTGEWVDGEWVGEVKRGLPISCFLAYVPDTLEGLLDHTTLTRHMSIAGGGVGGHWNHVRGISEKSTGIIPFLKTADADVQAYRQGKTRKGSYAAYTDISHPDIVEFVGLRKPTGGDADRKCFNLHHAVNITDKFMDAVRANEEWDLICPHSGTIRDTVKARGLWESLIDTRSKTGEPYLNFIDTVNRALPKVLKKKGLRVHGSNLCNEIHLPTAEGRAAVCCLLSLNLEFYDEWKNTSLVQDLTRFLDNVLEWFITHAPKEMAAAVNGAKRERPLGIGAMGFHSYLQKMLVPFESAYATHINIEMFKYIQGQARYASYKLAKERGEPEDMKGTGMRNSHLLAVAPNANSSVILGTSPSIEPWKSNSFTMRTRAGSQTVRNTFLDKIIRERFSGEDVIEKVWRDIGAAQGSVQHVDWLTPYEKDVFKTAFEIDMHWVVEHGANRQKHICQGQSLNLFFPHGSARSYINSVHLKAHSTGVKGLYYFRTESSAKGDAVSQKIERVALSQSDEAECLSCEG